MMKLASRAFLIAGLICACSIAYLALYSFVPGPQLALLESDNIVVIDYWTGGCGHNEHYLLTFRDGISDNATIEQLWDAGRPPDDKKPTIVTVQPHELHWLDQYIHSHRVRWFSNGWSTEGRIFSIAWFQHGRMLRSESFVDRRPHGYYEDEYNQGRTPFTFEDLTRPVHPIHVNRFAISTRSDYDGQP